MLSFAPESFIASMTLLLGTFLYVEIHYRAGFLPSRYYSREPEILADAPWRIEPGLPIPVFLIVKDAHRYPIFLLKVLVVIEYDRGTRSTLEIPLNMSIAERWWHQLRATIMYGQSCIVYERVYRDPLSGRIVSQLLILYGWKTPQCSDFSI
jgi:hypothetical protein